MKLYADRPSAVIYLLACLFFPRNSSEDYFYKINRTSTIFEGNQLINRCSTSHVFTVLEIVIRWLCCAVPIFFVCLFVCLFEFFSIFISIQLTISPNRWALIPNNHWSRIHIYSDFLKMIVIMMMIFINARVIVVVASTEKQDRAIYAFTLKKFFFCFHSSNH